MARQAQIYRIDYGYGDERGSVFVKGKRAFEKRFRELDRIHQRCKAWKNEDGPHD